MTKFIIFDKGKDADFEAMNEKIQAHKIATVKDYNAERWSRKLVSDEDGKIAIVIKDDIQECLSAVEKTKIVEELPTKWIKPMDIDAESIKK